MFPDGMTHIGSVYDFPWLTQTPTPIPPTPTIVPALDPASVSGTYQSEPLTLSNNKKAQLTLTLRPDNSAELETNYENEQPIISTGSWTDNGDGTLSIAVTDSNQKTIEIKFNVSNDLLQANEFPAFYGEAGIDMKRLVSATPIPASTETPEPDSTSPAPQSSSPLCGSAALIPLVAIIWQVQQRKRKY